MRQLRAKCGRNAPSIPDAATADFGHGFDSVMCQPADQVHRHTLLQHHILDAGVGFLDGLRSGEKDIHAFAESRRGRRRRSRTREPNAPAADASAEP
jgi:hypothetical protein